MKLILIISFTHVNVPIYNQCEKLTNELLIFSNSCPICETQCMLYSYSNSQSSLAMLQLVNCFTEVQIRHGNSE